MMCPEGNGWGRSVLDSTWWRYELAVLLDTRYGYSCNTGQQYRQMEESNLPIRPAFKFPRCSTFFSRHNQLYEQIRGIEARYRKNSMETPEQAEE